MANSLRVELEMKQQVLSFLKTNNTTLIYTGAVLLTALLTGIGTFYFKNAGEITVYGADINPLLPVDLAFFNAQPTKEGQVAITWSTITEQDNDFFVLERSIDGQNFFVLDTLDGAGTSNTTKSYTYTDSYPVAGSNYYRLKQTNYDGKFNYLHTVSVTSKKAKPALYMVSIGPNPYQNQFEVSFYSIDNNAVHLKLMDMEGKILFTKSIETAQGHNSYTYTDNQDLQPGIYLFSIVQKGTPAKTFRVVKSS